MPRWAAVAGHTLWFYFNEEHRRPHVAIRGEHRATLDLVSGEVLAGNLPRKLHREIWRFLRIHHDAAMDAWEAVRSGEHPATIRGEGGER